jgi:DNA-binding MarR family transcriptional regulator
MASLAALTPGDQVEFTWLRDRLELTDGNLGAHLLKLEEAGYIKVDKRFVARKPKTYVALSNKGRGAFEEHVAALESILRVDAKADARDRRE